MHIIWGVCICYCNAVIQWGRLYAAFQKISNSLFLPFFFLFIHTNPPALTMHACFVFSNGVSLDTAELDDWAYLFWVAAPCPKSALICYSFFESAAMVGCMNGRPDYSTVTDSETHSPSRPKKAFNVGDVLGFIFLSNSCSVMVLISLMDASEWIWTWCSLTQTDVIILHCCF